MWVLSLDREDPLEEGMATHSSVLAWRIHGQRSLVGLQSVESQRVGHEGCAKFSPEIGIVSFWILVILRSKV